MTDFKRVLIHRYDDKIRAKRSFSSYAIDGVNKALAKAEEQGLVLNDEAVYNLIHNYGLYKDNLLAYIKKEASIHKLKVLIDATIEQLAVMFDYAEEAKQTISKAMYQSYGDMHSLDSELYNIKGCRLKAVEDFDYIIEEDYSIYLENQQQVDIIEKAKQIEALSLELHNELREQGDFLQVIRQDGHTRGLLTVSRNGSLKLRTDDIGTISSRRK